MATARFVFLGTGTSERVPRITCLSKQPPTCEVCIDSQRPGSKNYRRNTSLLIQAPNPDGSPGGPGVNIVIDAGKSFYEACMQWFPKFGVRNLDAVVITHAHADAIAGLDDLRDWTNNNRTTMPLYVRRQDMETLSKTHFYIVDASTKMSGGGVARLDIIQTEDDPFDVLGVEFTPLPVEHGPRLHSQWLPHRQRLLRTGRFSNPPPDTTIELIEGCETLILDALRPGRTHGSHLTIEEAVELAKEIRAQRTLFTDMTHDIEHEAVNAELAKLQRLQRSGRAARLRRPEL